MYRQVIFVISKSYINNVLSPKIYRSKKYELLSLYSDGLSIEADESRPFWVNLFCNLNAALAVLP